MDLVKVYKSIVRPVVEYACQVWGMSLTKELSDNIESIQRRAFKIIFPHLTYHQACTATESPQLITRRESMCKKLFKDIENPEHKLFDLLPEKYNNTYSLRKNRKYVPPKCKTNRYKNSFFPWCAYNL